MAQAAPADGEGTPPTPGRGDPAPAGALAPEHPAPQGSSAPAPPGASGSAARKAALIVGSQLAGAAFGYLALLVIGRYVSRDDIGSFYGAGAVIGFLAVVGNLGIGQAHLKHLSTGEDPSRAVGIVLRLRLLTFGGIGLIATGLYLLWTVVFHHRMTDTTVSLLAVQVILNLLTLMRQVPFETWLGQQKVNRVEIAKFVDTAFSVGFLALVGFALGWAGGRPTPWPALSQWVAHLLHVQSPTGEQAALMVGFAYTLGKGASMLPVAYWALEDKLSIGKWDYALARSYMRFALPVALTNANQLIVQYTDQLVLLFWWSDGEVGLYGVAGKLANMVNLAGMAASTVLFPRFAALFHAGRHDEAKQTMRQAERAILIAIVPLAAALWAMPRLVIHIGVGDGYLGAADVLPFAAAGCIVGGLTVAVSAKFLGASNLRIGIVASAINAVLNLALNLLLVPQPAFGLGPAGSALASALAATASYLYLRLKARQAYGVSLVDSSQLRILGAGLVVGLAWWYAANHLPPALLARAWQFGLLCLAGTTLFYALLAVSGEIGRKDLVAVRDVLHPGAMMRELRGKS